MKTPHRALQNVGVKATGRSRTGMIKATPGLDPKKTRLPRPDQSVIKERLKSLEVAEIELMEKMKEYRTRNLIEFFTKPNPAQAKLLAAWKRPEYKVFTFTGANRIGKCAMLSAPIETIKGKVLLGDLYADRKPFEVWSWDGTRRVRAVASAPFKKARKHKCYRVEMSDGAILELADRHRVLTSHGWIYVEQLQVSADSLPGSSLEHDRSVPHEDARHLRQTCEDYQGHYSESSRRDGEQLLSGSDSARASFPLQGDARLHGSSLCSSDDPGRKSSSILSRGYDLLSIPDDLRRSVVRYAEILCHTFGKTLSLFFLESLLQPKLAFESGPCPLPETSIAERLLHVSCSYDTPFKIIGENTVQCITPMSARQEVFDFQVEKYKNYFAGGIVHHNTTIGTILGVSTVFGKYLWNGEALYFPKDQPRRVRYVGQDWEKQIRAVVIPELEKWWPKDRKVIKKKNSNGVDAFWTDVETGSTLEIMSNKQESELHEGWSGDLVIYDEPPTRDIRVANARGLIDRRGRELFCMTLIKEAWIDREIIKAINPETGRPDMSVFNINADISVNVGFGITQAGVDQFAKTLTDDQKAARLKGVPSYMSGLVYPQYERRVHLIERFQVPMDWLVDVAIDIHPREKQAVLFIATAPNGVKYLVNEIWGHGDGTWVGDQVSRCCKLMQYRVNRVIIDPLSKGDKNNLNTVFDKVQLALWQNGYSLETAPKDKTSGILLTRDHLMGPNNMPSLYIFDDQVRTIYEIEGYMYDKETQNPMDKDDHMMENLYRLILLGTTWYEMRPDEGNNEDAFNSQGRSHIGGY